MTLLDTTALLHESYLKLVGANALPVEDRRHFFTYAATVMRSVIVDFARARSAERRGGEADHLALDTACPRSWLRRRTTCCVFTRPSGAGAG